MAPGGSLLYAITVTNNGSDAATGVSLSDISAGGHDVQLVQRGQWLDRDHARGGGNGNRFGDDREPGRECVSEFFACGSG